MNVDIQLDDLNFAIQATCNEIERKGNLIDRIIVRGGDPSAIEAEIDRLCDERDALLAQRRSRGY